MTDPYEVMWNIEETQCRTCRFRKNEQGSDGSHAEEFPMCYEIEGALIVGEDYAEGLDRDEFDAVVCTKYRHGDPWETFGVHPEQPQLF